MNEKKEDRRTRLLAKLEILINVYINETNRGKITPDISLQALELISFTCSHIRTIKYLDTAEDGIQELSELLKCNVSRYDTIPIKYINE